jgi:ubiquinone/menaquinone biosynthesis C-methylase UbiE
MVIDDDIEAFYRRGEEATRLQEGYFPLERERTRELVLRHLAPTPASVLDVGGGAGAYALWLSGLGYEVHLVDPVPLHVEQARAASAATTAPLASAATGDARRLESGDARFDAVLLLGPLYHLVGRGERLLALGEARRVLRPGGVLFAAAISRYASLVDGLRSGSLLDDPAFAAIVERDLRDGVHVNDTGNPRYFTTSFFHEPEELRAEVAEAGFEMVDLVGLEGAGTIVQDFAACWNDPKRRETVLRFVRLAERAPALMGVSPHLLAVGRRPR